MRALLILFLSVLAIAGLILLVTRGPQYRRKQKITELEREASVQDAALRRIEDHTHEALQVNPEDVLAQQVQHELQQIQRQLLGGSQT